MRADSRWAPRCCRAPAPGSTAAGQPPRVAGSRTPGTAGPRASVGQSLEDRHLLAGDADVVLRAGPGVRRPQPGTGDQQQRSAGSPADGGAGAARGPRGCSGPRRPPGRSGPVPRRPRRPRPRRPGWLPGPRPVQRGIVRSPAAPSTRAAAVPSASTTSATITVMLSMPPSARASDTSFSTAASRSGSRSAASICVVVDQAAHAVAAEHQPVAGHHRHHGQVGVVRRLAVEHLQQQRPVRVDRGVGLADLAVVDQGLNPAVVVGEPLQLALAQPVGAAVADVGQAEPAPSNSAPVKVVPMPSSDGSALTRWAIRSLARRMAAGQHVEHLLA